MPASMIVAVAATSEPKNATKDAPARSSGGMIAVSITCEVTTKNGEKMPLTIATAMIAAMKGLDAIRSARDRRREAGGGEAGEKREARHQQPDGREEHGHEQRHGARRDGAHDREHGVGQPHEGAKDVVARIRRERRTTG